MDQSKRSSAPIASSSPRPAKRERSYSLGAWSSPRPAKIAKTDVTIPSTLTIPNGQQTQGTAAISSSQLAELVETLSPATPPDADKPLTITEKRQQRKTLLGIPPPIKVTGSSPLPDKSVNINDDAVPAKKAKAALKQRKKSPEKTDGVVSGSEANTEAVTDTPSKGPTKLSPSSYTPIGERMTAVLGNKDYGILRVLVYDEKLKKERERHFDGIIYDRIDWNDKKHINAINAWRDSMWNRSARDNKKVIVMWLPDEDLWIELFYQLLIREALQRKILKPTNTMMCDAFNTFFEGVVLKDKKGEYEAEPHKERKTDAFKTKAARTARSLRERLEALVHTNINFKPGKYEHYVPHITPRMFEKYKLMKEGMKEIKVYDGRTFSEKDEEVEEWLNLLKNLPDWRDEEDLVSENTKTSAAFDDDLLELARDDQEEQEEQESSEAAPLQDDSGDVEGQPAPLDDESGDEDTQDTGNVIHPEGNEDDGAGSWVTEDAHVEDVADDAVDERAMGKPEQDLEGKDTVATAAGTKDDAAEL